MYYGYHDAPPPTPPWADEVRRCHVGVGHIVDPPLHSVQVYEKILQPSKPFTVWTTRAGFEQPSSFPLTHEDYLDFRKRGGLFRREGDVSFIITDLADSLKLGSWFEQRGFQCNALHYLVVPWVRRGKSRTFVKPLVAFLQAAAQLGDPTPRDTYEVAVTGALKELGLLDYSFATLTENLLPQTTEDCFNGVLRTSTFEVG